MIEIVHPGLGQGVPRARERTREAREVLRADWPDWAVWYVAQAAYQLENELSGMSPDANALHASALEGVDRALSEAVRRDGDLEAEESWWDRWDDGEIYREVEAALRRLA